MTKIISEIDVKLVSKSFNCLDCEDDYDLPGPSLHIEDTPTVSPIPPCDISVSRKSSFDQFTLPLSILNTTDSRVIN